MAEAIKSLSYLFTYSRRLEEYSTFSRLFTSITLISLVFTVIYISSSTVEEGLLQAVLVASLITIISYFKGFKQTMSAIRLVVLFILLGSILYTVSNLMGWVSPSLIEVFTGSLRLVSFFLSFSLLFQVMSIREWKSILSIIGLDEYSLVFGLAVLQIPITIYYVSEAYTTIKLKYGSRRLHKIIVPLIMMSLFNARSIFESSLLYGYISEQRPSLFRKKDISIYLALTTLILTLLALSRLI